MIRVQLIQLLSIHDSQNPFYVNTVRDFRDRRNEFKAKLKEWKDSMHAAQEAQQPERVEQAKNMIIVYDSLQVAHKVLWRYMIPLLLFGFIDIFEFAQVCP